MRVNTKILSILFACAILQNCASVPTHPPLYTAQKFFLCNGINVSNAPATDQKRQVKGFQAIKRIKGLSLLTVPVNGCLTSGFGTRTRTTKGKRAHKGIDISTKGSAPISAGGDGIVAFMGKRGSYGRLIEITHKNGIKTRYAHLSDFAPSLKVGQFVKIGQHIGQTGKTGNASGIHLHYEIIVDDQHYDPLDF